MSDTSKTIDLMASELVENLTAEAHKIAAMREHDKLRADTGHRRKRTRQLLRAQMNRFNAMNTHGITVLVPEPDHLVPTARVKDGRWSRAVMNAMETDCFQDEDGNEITID